MASQDNNGTALVEGKKEEQLVLPRPINVAKNSWNDMPILCPSCNKIMIAPLMETDAYIFCCINCKSLLEKPVFTERLFFFVDASLYKVGKYMWSWQGKEEYGQIDVLVPNESKGGDTVQAFYRGQPYIVKVPEGLIGGDKFTVKIDLTNTPPQKIYRAKLAQVGQPFEYVPPAPYKAEGIVKSESVKMEVIEPPKSNKKEEIEDAQTDTPKDVRVEEVASA